MTINVLGPGHYVNTNETLTRPTPVSTGIDGRSWFAQCDADGNGGTNIDDQWLNAVLAELRAIIDSSGAVQSSENVGDMIAEACGRIASGAIFGVDTGAVNAYVVKTSLTFVQPKSYFLGMRVVFRAANAPTGASTLNFSNANAGAGVGAKALLKPDGNPLAGGEFAQNALVECFYDPAAAAGVGGFRLAPWSVSQATTTPAVAPAYPEITTNDGVMLFTTTTGQIIVNGSQTWLHRLLKQYASSDILEADRTFNTSANKTYHLRWYAPGHAQAPSVSYPNGRFMLRDLADTASYNTGSAAENSTIFDTKFDDMLCAKVVTNGSNVLTVTALLNKALLIGNAVAGETTSTWLDEYTDQQLDTAGYGTTWTRNWSRKGESMMANVTDFTSYNGANPTEMHLGVFARDRYTTRIFGMSTSNSGNGYYVRAVAIA